MGGARVEGVTEPRPDRPVAFRAVSSRSSGWPALIAVIPLAVPLLRLLLVWPQVWLWGDQALIDVNTSRVVGGHTLLGPYSRYGWHHPGPMWFWWLAPFRLLTHASPTALVAAYLAQGVILVVLIVVVTRRLLGLRAAWIMAGLLIAFVWSFGYQRLLLLWSPYAMALPALLLMLSAATFAVTRRPWLPLLAMAMVGSFMVQTDISTSIVVGTVCLAAAACRLAAWRAGALQGEASTHHRHRWVAPVLVGLALAVVWAPPLYQQFVQPPGNVRLVKQFAEGDQGPRSGVRQGLRAVNSIVAGYPSRLGEDGQGHDADPATIQDGWGWRIGIVYVAGGALLAVAAWRRGDRRRSALAVISVTAVIGAYLSGAQVTGPLYPYLLYWTQIVVVPLWLLAAERVLALIQTRSPVLVRARAVRIGAVAVIAASACIVASTSFDQPVATGSSVDIARSSWRLVEGAVTDPDVETVTIRLSSLNAGPVAAAIADQAVRRGRSVGFSPEFAFLVDADFVGSTHPDLELYVRSSLDPPAPPDQYQLIGSVGGFEIYGRR